MPVADWYYVLSFFIRAFFMVYACTIAPDNQFNMYRSRDLCLHSCRLLFQPGPGIPNHHTGRIRGREYFAFDPPALTVKTGTAVTWVNNDSPPHALASDAGSPVAFSSDPLATGASYTFTFTQTGTYRYHCSIHPSMTGTIIVQ
jgi:hypothetical protein